MSLRAVLFDLDNTLYAYAPCNEAALRHVCALLGETVETSWERFRTVHDAVRDDLAQRLQGQAASHNRSIFFKEIVERITERPNLRLAVDLFDAYWQEFFRQMRIEPDALHVLEDLRRDFRLAIVSNHTTRIQLEKIDTLGIAACFDVIVTSEEVGVEKPDRAIFEFALARLGAEAATAAMVGDHPKADIAGAKALGIKTIHTRQFTGDEHLIADPDHEIRRLAEVLPILRP